MHLYSLAFLCLGLPLCLGLYRITPPRFRMALLLTLSLVFYAALEPLSFPIMLGSLLIDYAASYSIHRHADNAKIRRWIMWALSAKAVGILVIASVLSQLYGIGIPLGLFIYTLSSLGYVVDVYRAEAPFQRDIIRFGVFSCFFGKLYAGPMVDYTVMNDQMDHPEYTLQNTGQGLRVFILGFAKKVVLADGIAVVSASLAALPLTSHTLVSAWLMVFCSLFSIYFLLSSYSDMAQGLGLLFGFKFPRNFYFPLQSPSITDFFDRFNMTVHRFIRRYVYRSLGEDSNTRASAILNIMLMNMLLGLWYGLELNKLLWGIFLGVFMTLELFYHKQFAAIPPFFSRIYSFAVILVSFAIFVGHSPAQSIAYLGLMFGLSGRPVVDMWALNLISTNYLLIIICFICSTSIFDLLGRYLDKRMHKTSQIAMTAATLAALALALAFSL